MKMNSLLTRQVRKQLDEDLKNNPAIKAFLEAVQGSYSNYEEQLSMLQRAMSISSEELFDANKRLKLEAEEQRKVIKSLTDTTKTLQSITYKKEGKKSGETEELSGIELANLIEEQAFQISKIETQRNLILKDLEKSNKELRDYAHVVSHDLKSPLRNINTLINWIKEDTPDLDKTLVSNLDIIDQNIEKMDNLINGILEYSVIDKKKHLVASIQLNEMLENTIKLLEKPENITFIIQDLLPKISGDKLRIQQIFQNLLSNAISSINKEKGIIEIGTIPYDKEGFWQFYVKDNGKGISKKYHEKIFQMFQSIDDSKASTGIGLSIVQKIVAHYGGKIWLESALEEGTTFYFTLKK
ncbi:ATP-binding protein [uncultured Aquimarina sp.]|uniref:sensor histidine kinase n=1 Tax=uncultured Aquimarina sp. TaxID=575652 RepID=UPI0026344EE3|nr:ATP-binding protein [uncultured Aquimarina sp.]